MTEKDKDLLLKDLCARLPYNLKCEYNGELYEVLGIAHDRVSIVKPFMSNSKWPLIEEVKPYLFPLSSMTEEQKRELRQMDAFISTFGNICFAMYDEYGHYIIPTYEDAIQITNWCNKNHFDYRGLIPKGLVKDATGLNIY